MLRSTIRLFRVRGVPVGINWTWLLVFLLIFWSLATALFPATYPGLSGAAYVAMALVATVLFFGSILVHELSHTLEALREGIRVREITLWLFGGVSRADEPLPDPGTELRVVAAGPLSSGGLALVFLGLTAAATAAGLPESVRGVLDYLARINGLLLAFNIVPALPLDGGRLLHALLWWRSGDRATATFSAATAGRIFAYLLIGLGLVGLLTGAGIGAIWFAFLGWFVLLAVHEEVLSARIEQAVSGLRVRDLMATDLVTVAPGMAIDDVAGLVVRRSRHGAYPVVDHGRFVGLLPLRRASAVPRQERLTTTVADVMLTGDKVPVVDVDEPMMHALDTLQQPPQRAVVLGGDTGEEVIGLLSMSDLSHALEVAPLRRREEMPRRRGTFAIWLGVVLIFLVFAAALYHPPYVVIAPGESFDIRGDITISGVPTQDPTGPYLLTSVQLSQPNALGLLVDAFRSDRQVIALGQVVPSGVPSGEVNTLEQEMFTDSQQMAAAAAALTAGFNASLTGSGAEVVGVVRSAPAASVLKDGDVITAVDGAPVRTTTDLHNAVSGHPAGQRLTLTVERNRQTIRPQVKTAQLPQVSGGVGIGVLAQTKDLRVVLPFQISFRSRPGFGGPSAGLAYTLAITDMLDRTDDARSRSIAATGTIAEDGSVGAVGGVHEKAIAAQDAGAEIFIVPAAEVSSVDEHRLETRGVSDLDQAVNFLRAS